MRISNNKSRAGNILLVLSLIMLIFLFLMPTLPVFITFLVFVAPGSMLKFIGEVEKFRYHKNKKSYGYSRR